MVGPTYLRHDETARVCGKGSCSRGKGHCSLLPRHEPAFPDILLCSSALPIFTWDYFLDLPSSKFDIVYGCTSISDHFLPYHPTATAVAVTSPPLHMSHLSAMKIILSSHTVVNFLPAPISSHISSSTRFNIFKSLSLCTLPFSSPSSQGAAQPNLYVPAEFHPTISPSLPLWLPLSKPAYFSTLADIQSYIIFSVFESALDICALGTF